MNPGSKVKAPKSLVTLPMLRQSGPTEPLRASRVVFLPDSRSTSSYFFPLIVFYLSVARGWVPPERFPSLARQAGAIK